MKKHLLFLAVALLALTQASAQYKRGDVNYDNVVNTADVVAVYNIILNGDTDPVGPNDPVVPDDPDDPDRDESGLYLGIIGFNQQPYKFPIRLLDADSRPEFDQFIDGLTSYKATVLYHSTLEAIDMLRRGTYPADLANVALVTFTDGLDQGSFMFNDLCSTDEEFMDSINYRIRNWKVQGLPINAYSIGLRGNDVNDINKFHLNLQKLASSSENAKEVSNISEVSAQLNKIAKSLVESSNVYSVDLTFPGLANGTRIRFKLDGASSATNSNLYIEGTFNLKNRSLENVTYHGMTTTSGSTLKGTVSGVKVTLHISGIKPDNQQIISSSNIKEYTYITSTNSWQINSEFDGGEDTKVETKRSSAVILLSLDCSSSLGNDFETAKKNAKSFVNTLANATGSNPTPTTGTYTANGVSFTMVPVKGGTFTMGATPEQGSDADGSEKPTHQVTLSDYMIGQTEVTQELWQAVMGSNPSYFKGTKLPVEQVSYTDCQTFIQKLNQLTGQTFRLPTEAEWEFAARGGNLSNGYKYSGSNTIGDVAWYTSNSSSKTHEVASKQPNELGIYDMSGNVWEWCADWFGSYSSSAQTDPTGPTLGSYRVARGGSWFATARNCRVSYRFISSPSNRSTDLGLRLAM